MLTDFKPDIIAKTTKAADATETTVLNLESFKIDAAVEAVVDAVVELLINAVVELLMKAVVEAVLEKFTAFIEE